jgi:aspartate/methionine/tyrosine aminotransferase
MQQRGSSDIADRLKPFGTTIFSEMTRLANEAGAVNLSQGFPDFDGPGFIREAACRAIEQGRNQYARAAGEPVLVSALAEDFAARTGIGVDPLAEVTVTAGCTEAIAATLLGLVNPGDEVVLFEPYYDSYRACVAMAGAIPRFVGVRRIGARFEIDRAELRAAFSSRTRAVLINTPHNPTGMVMTRAELAEIADLARAHDALVLADEVYEHLTYGVEHVSIASLPGMWARTVTLSSLGKTFSLTGWKIGWAIAPAGLSAGVRAAHQFLTFAVSTPMQHAAAEAIRHGVGPIAEIRRRYLGARDGLVESLRSVGFDPVVPEGTYFIMADHEPISRRLGVVGDVALAKRLIGEVGVAAIPPSVFCERPELGAGFLRFAFCKRPETLAEAVRRLERLRP